MEYRPELYLTNERNTCRFYLGTRGSRTLHVIGLNPSTADDQRPDQTITKVMGFAERNGYDSFLMWNLYPRRTPFPDQLPMRMDRRLVGENLRHLEAFLRSENTNHVLAAWGSPILVRPYFIHCLTKVVECSRNYPVEWWKIGSLTKAGHPRHPSRAAYRSGLTIFDPDNYLQRLTPKK